ncbi:MAG: VCBS repeat-containing protein [Tidjanibacter sp.]|nr:VCBS repeat-containing protein [Tidjanibacter sp.]
MKQTKPILCSLLLLLAGSLCPTRLVAQEPVVGRPLVSGAALPATLNDGLAQLSCDFVITPSLIGSVNISSEEFPDLFVNCSSNKNNKPVRKPFIGCYYFKFKELGPDNNPIYYPAEKVEAPWSPENGNVKLYRIGDMLYAFSITSKKLHIAYWDETLRSFGKEWMYEGDVNVPMTVVDFDLVPQGSSATVVLMCRNKRSREPKIKSPAQAEYDSAGIYRGDIAEGQVLYTKLNLVEFTFSRFIALTPPKAILTPRAITAVQSPDGALSGCVIGNKNGALKYIPFTNPSAMDYIRNESGEVITNHCLIADVLSLKAGASADFFTSGEGGMTYYQFSGKFTPSGAPIYKEPKMVLHVQNDIHAGSLVSQSVADWDGDGVVDIVAGNSAGHIMFFKNYGTNSLPAFGLGEYIKAGGRILAERAGYYESQGPEESAWGYMGPTVFDWDGNGTQDIVYSYNDVIYKVVRNVGTPQEPLLTEPETIMIDGVELAGVWRCRPGLVRVGGKVMMLIADENEALHLYEKSVGNNVIDRGLVRLKDGKIITGHSTNFGERHYGMNGRKKLELADWDGDGDVDLLIGCARQGSFPSPELGLPGSRGRGLQAIWLENVGSNEQMVFDYPRQFTFRGVPYYVGGHETTVTTCPFGDTTGGVNLLVGVECGRFVFFEREDLKDVSLWY